MACADLSCNVDLAKLCRSFLNCEFSLEGGPRLKIHTRDPKGILKIDTRGGMHIACKGSEEKAKHCLKRVARRALKVGGLRVRFRHFRVLSTIAGHSLPRSFDFDDLVRMKGTPVYLSHKRHVRFDVDVGRPDGATVATSVHEDGRINISGARDSAEHHLILESFLPSLSSCKANSEVEARVPKEKKRKASVGGRRRPKSDEGSIQDDDEPSPHWAPSESSD